MKDYSDLGLDANLKKPDSIAGRKREYTTALDADFRQEPTPYLHQTAISKGTLQTVSGGITELVSTTGGTTLFTVDPNTGTVTIAGPVQANVSINVGTVTNTTLAGATTLSGTLTNQRLMQNGTWNNGTLGTPQITGGTANMDLFSSGGTGGISGSIVYVKTVDFVGSTTTVGTLRFTNGIITSNA